MNNKSNTVQKALTRSARPGAMQKALTKAVVSLLPPRTLVRGGSQSKAKNSISNNNSLKSGIVANVNSSFSFRNKVPTYTGVSGGIRIRHTEFVTDLSASNTAKAFGCEKYNINPANSNLFPWLSTAEARSYSTFIPNNIKFIIKSVVATSKDGSAMIVATADVTDPLPLTKTQFLKTGDASRGHIFSDFSYTIPNNILHRLPEYLTYSNPGVSTDTSKAVGSLFVGSSGCEASVDYGELYVEYDFTLLNTQDTIYSTSLLVNGGFSPTRPFMQLGNDSPIYQGNIYLTCQDTSGAINPAMLRVDEGGSKIITFRAFLTSEGTSDSPGNIRLYDVNNVQIDFNVSMALVAVDKFTNLDGTNHGFNVVLTAKNLPSPFYISWFGITGAYENGTVRISPYHTTSDVGDADRIEDRLKRIENIVDEEVHTFVEHTPNTHSKLNNYTTSSPLARRM